LVPNIVPRMADRYIDHEETLLYGPYAARKIKAVALGLHPKFDPALTYLADEIMDATQAMDRALQSARRTDSSHRAGVKDKQPALAQARDVLRRLGRHLDAHKAGTIDKKRFFPSGSLTENGTSAPRVLLLLGHLTTELAMKDCGVSDAKTWHKEISEAAGELSPVIAHADSARTIRRGQTAELEQARTAWLQVYLAARCAVESVLRITGKLHLLPAIFYDLAVPGDTKLTTPPPEPVPPEPAVAPADPSAPAAPAAATPAKKTRKRR
jgi:hypothetical protein